MQTLVDPVPEVLKIKARLNLSQRLGEFESLKIIEKSLSKNRLIDVEKSFIPDYPYYSYIPAAVDYLSSVSELLTSYTSYQAEISQGLLQILFEFQSLICELTGMDVANASMYDHSTALSEALLMAIKLTDKKKVLIPKFMRKERKQVVYTYLRPHNIEIYEYHIDEKGFMDLEEIENNIKDSAAFYAENPTYFGIIDPHILNVDEIVKKNNAIFIVGAEPISLGLFREPVDYGADIVIGEAQHLAINPYYGGPSLGFIACRNDLKLIHSMPGRIVGMTSTLDGSNEGFILALQAREQHIKREKATSNITTNTSWLAVRAAIYISLLGKTGLKRLAVRIFNNTKILIQQLQKIHFANVLFPDSVHFRNVLVKINKDANEIINKIYSAGYAFGKNLSKDFPEFVDCLLLGVNELHNKEAIIAACKTFEEFLKNV
jgi:Glycine cleavage system protein P (pyridoxal-binding), N-terminal domain